MSHLNRTLMSELSGFPSGRPKSVNTLMHCLLKIPKGWPPAKATSLRLPHQDPHPLANSAQRFQMTKNPPKLSLPDVISRIFPHRFQQICIISVSGDCMHCIFETCQVCPSISMISQFHKFSYRIVVSNNTCYYSENEIF